MLDQIWWNVAESTLFTCQAYCISWITGRIIRRSLIFHFLWKTDLISVWKKVHEMVTHLSQIFSSTLCSLFYKHFFICFKYDVAERMIIKNSRNVKKCLLRWFKRIMYGTIPLPYWRMVAICTLRSTKLILVGYGQLNSTVLVFCNRHYDTSYLNMHHFCAGHIFFRSDSSFCEIPEILYNRSVTTGILE